ncbi:AAA family ATPase [Nocardioides aquiterrae]|uniref:Adenylate kinase n=1 Tax=Nocardioides aquiterrae TaxID=203799 RepID=A0ABN1URE5_9ACTN
MLSAADPLPHRPARIAVAGVSGSGKSTLARRLATLLDLPYTELDSLFHGPGWTPRPTFRAEVEELVRGDRWVCEWQYDEARPLVAARAELLVWVDLPFRVTLVRLVRRTVGRRVRREELWHGNREAPLHTFFTDRDHVVRWAVRSRRSYHQRIPAVAAEHPRLVVVRLRSARDVDRWVREVLEPLA